MERRNDVQGAATPLSEFEMDGTEIKNYRGSSAHVAIPDSVIAIGKEAFKGCDSLKEIRIPDSVTVIGEGAFHSCPLESVALPNYIKEIPTSCFKGCMSLRSIRIPELVTKIGMEAFAYCASLKAIYIPEYLACYGNIGFSRYNILADLPSSCIIYVPSRKAARALKDNFLFYCKIRIGNEQRSLPFVF